MKRLVVLSISIGFFCLYGAELSNYESDNEHCFIKAYPISMSEAVIQDTWYHPCFIPSYSVRSTLPRLDNRTIVAVLVQLHNGKNQGHVTAYALKHAWCQQDDLMGWWKDYQSKQDIISSRLVIVTPGIYEDETLKILPTSLRHLRALRHIINDGQAVVVPYLASSESLKQTSDSSFELYLYGNKAIVRSFTMCRQSEKDVFDKKYMHESVIKF